MKCVENLPSQTGTSDAFLANALCDPNTNSGKCPICVFSSSGGKDIVTVSNLNSVRNTVDYNVVLTNTKNPKAAIPMSNPVCSSYVTTALADTVTPAVSITFTPITSTASVTMSSNPPKNGEYAALTFSFATGMTIPINGGVMITCPYANKDFLALGITTNQSMLPANVNSLAATGTFTSSQGSNVPLGTLTVVGNFSDQTVQIFLSNSVDLTTGGTLSLTISTLLNPPSLAPLTGFKIQTALVKTVNASKVQYAIEVIDNSNIKLTNTQLNNADATSTAAVNPASPISADGATYQFTIVTKNTIPKGGFITLTVPATVTVPGNSVATFSVSCASGCSSTSAVLSYDSTTRTLKISGLFSTNSGMAGGSTLVFSVTGWTNPSTFTPALFTWASFAVISSTNYGIDDRSNLAIIPAVGVCTISSAVASDGNSQIYAVPASYQIIMKCDSKILNSHELTLTWPTQFFINTGACIVGSLNASYSCTATASTRTILIKTFTDTSLPAKTNFTFTVTGVRNAGTFGVIDSISIALKTTGGALTTDQGTYDFPDTYFTAGKIQAFTVTPQGGVVDQNPDTYSFVVRPGGDMWAGSYIQLTISTDISVSNPTALQTTCGTNLVGFTSSSITCTLNSKVLKLTAGFSSATTNISGYASTSKDISFDLAGFVNPPTINSAAWKATIYDVSNKAMYTWDSTTTPIVTMKQGKCTFTTFDPSDKGMYAIPSQYTISMTCQQQLDLTSGIKVIFPTSDFYVAISTTCILTGMSQTYTCTSDATTGTLQFDKATAVIIPSATLFTFKINSVRNPGKMVGISPVIVRTIKQDGTTLDQGTYQFADNTFTYGTVSSFLVTPADYAVLTTPTTYTFSITPAGDIPVGSKLELTLPVEGPTIPDVAALQSNCGSNLTTPGASITCAVSGQTLTITTFQKTAEITGYTSNMIALVVTVNQLKNPATTTKTSVFKVQITSSSGQLLYKWDSTKGSPTVQMAQGVCTVTLAKPTSTNGIYAIPPSFGFSLTCMQQLDPNSGIQILLPADFMVKDGACSVTQQSTNYSCNGDSVTRTITITNLPALTILPNTNWSFTVTGVRNPGKLSGIGNLIVKTTKVDGTVLDVGTYVWPAGTFGASTVQTFTIASSSGKVLQPSKYTFTIEPLGDIPANSVFKITIPSTVTLTSPTTFLQGCGNDVSTATPKPLSCTVSGQDIRITGVQPTAVITSLAILKSTITIELQRFTNPGTTDNTTPFDLSIYDGANNVLYTWDSVVAPVLSITQGILTIYSITATDNQAIYGKPTSYKFILKNMVTIQPTDKITIEFTSDFIINQNVKCTATNFQSSLTTCISYDTTRSIVIQNIVTAPFPANQFEFTVDSIRNPGNMGGFSSPITMFTSKSDDAVVDTGYYTMPSGYYKVGAILTFEVVPLLGGLNAKPVDYTFTFQPDGNIVQGSLIKIVIPPEVSIADPVTFVNQAGPSLSQTAGTASVITLSSDNKTITITDAFKASGYQAVTAYGDSGKIFQFTLTGFKNPATTNPTTAFGISITDKNSLEMFKWTDTTKPKIVITQGICTTKIVRPIVADNIFSYSKYEFTMTCMQELPIGASIEITFPPQFILYDQSSCIIYQVTPNIAPNLGTPYAANTGYICKTEFTARKLTMSNFLTKAYPGGVEFSVWVEQIRNPGVIGPIGILQIRTYNQQGSTLDSGVYDFLDGLNTPAIIKDFQVQSLNQGLNQYPVTYRFKITPQGDVPQGAIIKIQYPAQIQIPNTSTFTNCAGTFFAGIKDGAFTCSVVANEIQVKDAFLSGATQKLSVPDGSGVNPDLFFELAGFQNPSTNSPTGAFNAQIVDKNGVLYYSWKDTKLPVLSASGVVNPIYAGFFRTNTANGQVTDYTFVITTFSILATGTSLKIILPPEVKITSGTTCSGVSANLAPDQTCTINGQSVIIPIQLMRRRFLQEPEDIVPPFGLAEEPLSAEAGSFLSMHELQSYLQQLAATQIASGAEIIFKISGLINPPTMRPTASIQYFALNPSGAILEQQTTGMPVINTVAGLLSACKTGIIPTTKTLGQAVPYILTLSPSNYEQNLQVQVTVPSEISIPSTMTCSTVSGIYQVMSCSWVGQVITVKDFVTYQATNPGTLQIQISQLNNPSTELVTGTFLISTTTSEGHVIDTLTTPLQIDFKCSDKCASCTTIYKDQCTSCYPTGPYAFFNAAQRSCDTGCTFGNALTTGTGNDPMTCNVCGIPGSASKLAVQAALLMMALLAVL